MEADEHNRDEHERDAGPRIDPRPARGNDFWRFPTRFVADRLVSVPSILRFTGTGQSDSEMIRHFGHPSSAGGASTVQPVVPLVLIALTSLGLASVFAERRDRRR